MKIRPQLIPPLIISLMLLLLLTIKFPPSQNYPPVDMEDFARCGGVSLAIMNFGVRDGVWLTQRNHGVSIIASFLIIPIFGSDNWLFLYTLFPLIVQSLIIVTAFTLLTKWRGTLFASLFCLLIILGPKLFIVTVTMYGSQQESFLACLLFFSFFALYTKKPRLRNLILLSFFTGLLLGLDPPLVILALTVIIYWLIWSPKKIDAKNLIFTIASFGFGFSFFFLMRKMGQEPFIESTANWMMSIIKSPVIILRQFEEAALKFAYLFDYGLPQFNIFIALVFFSVFFSFLFFLKNYWKEERSNPLTRFLLIYMLIFMISYTIAIKLDRYHSIEKAFSQRNIIYLYLPFFYFVCEFFFIFWYKMKVHFRVIGIFFVLLFIIPGVLYNFNEFRSFPRISHRVKSYHFSVTTLLNLTDKLGCKALHLTEHSKWSFFLFSKGEARVACGFDRYLECPWSLSFLFEKIAMAEKDYCFLFPIPHFMKEDQLENVNDFKSFLNRNQVNYTYMFYNDSNLNVALFYNFSSDIRQLKFGEGWNWNELFFNQ